MEVAKIKFVWASSAKQTFFYSNNSKYYIYGNGEVCAFEKNTQPVLPS